MKKATALTFLACLACHATALAAHYQVYLLGGQSNGNGRADAAQLTAPLNAAQTDVRLYWNRTQAVSNVGWVLENQWTNLAPGTGHGTGAPVYAKEFGPEVSFGRAMANAKPTANIAIIKYTHGGTNLSSNWAASGIQYTTFVSTVQTALAALTSAGHTYELRGMLWQQGESDTSGSAADNYQANLTSLIARVRTDLNGGAAFPFVIGSLSDSQYSNITTVGSGPYKVRQAQQAVAAADPAAGIVITDGYTTRPGDAIHLDHAAQISLGQSFSTQMLALEAALSPPPQVISLSPADDDLAVAPDANFVITFNEPVAKGTTGAVTIKYDYGSTTTFETIPITDSRITVDGAVLTINPTGILTPHACHILIDAGAIQDLDGTPWEGISSSTTWNFAVTLVATTTGVFDENTDATNAIDIQNPASTLAPFQTAVQSAFNNHIGGVIDWERGTTVRSSSTTDSRNNFQVLDAKYGAGGTKNLRITFDRRMELYTNNINSQVQVLSREGSAKSNAILPAGTTSTSREYNMSFHGAPVLAIGAAMPSRNTYAANGVTSVTFRATATFSSSPPAIRDFTVGGVPGTGDTFLYFAPPAGETITGFGVKWLSETGGTLADGQRRPILDDLGFVLAPDHTYASWIDGFFPGVTDAAIVGFDADPDHDGVRNGVENFFGTAPDAWSPGIVSGTVNPAQGTFTFIHPEGVLADDLAAAYQWSKDLQTFHPNLASDAGGTTVGFTVQPDTPQPGTTTVTATVTGTPCDRLFLRVAVTED
jgi:hypothetical protein